VPGFAIWTSLEKLILSVLRRQDPSFHTPRLVLQIGGIMASGDRNFSLFSNNVPYCVRISALGSISTSKPLCFLIYAIYSFVHTLAFGKLLEILPRTPCLKFQKVERDVLDDPGRKYHLAKRHSFTSRKSTSTTNFCRQYFYCIASSQLGCRLTSYSRLLGPSA
jgi:hypothetical protein